MCLTNIIKCHTDKRIAHPSVEIFILVYDSYILQSCNLNDSREQKYLINGKRVIFHKQKIKFKWKGMEYFQEIKV